MNKIVIKNNVIVSAVLPIYFFKADKNKEIIFAECPALAICTYGNNLTHAKKMFKEAFSLWLETVNENRNILEVLKELGWKMSKSAAYPKKHNYNTPFQLLASNSLNFSFSLTATAN
jgi:hypothetical protein